MSRAQGPFTFSVACQFETLSVRVAETVSSVTIMQPITGKYALQMMVRTVLDSLGRYLNKCKIGLLKAVITITQEGPVYPDPTTATSTSRTIGR